MPTCWARSSSPVARQHDARHTSTLGNPQNRAQVLRICHPIEDEQERRLGSTTLHQVFELEALQRRSHGENALWRIGAREGFELVGSGDEGQPGLLGNKRSDFGVVSLVW